ncbi:MAG: glycosyltransferase family 4 protein [Opitutales bacterium]|nr:glycosyltransferase family 4 protein [Opitutales bacterium]
MIRVLQVGNFESDRQLSMQRYARLMSGLFDENDGVAVHTISAKPILSRRAETGSAWEKWAGYVDKFALFPRQLRQEYRKLKAEEPNTLVHILDHSNAPFIHAVDPGHCLITCHDLFAVESAVGMHSRNPVRWSGRRLQGMIARGLRRSRHVATVSGFTRRRFESLFPSSKRQVEVVHSAFDRMFRPLPESKARWAVASWQLPYSRPWTFAIGNNSWYKNRSGLLRIFNQVLKLYDGPVEQRPMLLIAGSLATAEQMRWIRQSKLEGDIRHLGMVSDEEVQAFYSLSKVMVHPSFYEGFGWPPLEAQACGCPVIAGNGGALTEVLADSALLVDPGRERLFAQSWSRLLQDAEWRLAFKEKGLRNVRRFSFNQMHNGYLKMYRSILGYSER